MRTGRGEVRAGHRGHIHVECSGVTPRPEFSLLTASSILTTSDQAMQTAGEGVRSYFLEIFTACGMSLPFSMSREQLLQQTAHQQAWISGSFPQLRSQQDPTSPSHQLFLPSHLFPLQPWVWQIILFSPPPVAVSRCDTATVTA